MRLPLLILFASLYGGCFVCGGLMHLFGQTVKNGLNGVKNTIQTAEKVGAAALNVVTTAIDSTVDLVNTLPFMENKKKPTKKADPPEQNVKKEEPTKKTEPTNSDDDGDGDGNCDGSGSTADNPSDDASTIDESADDQSDDIELDNGESENSQKYRHGKNPKTATNEVPGEDNNEAETTE